MGLPTSLSATITASRVQQVSGSLNFTSTSNPTKRSQASAKDKHEEQKKQDAGYKPERGSPQINALNSLR
jgi:hypothetical protein